MGEGRLGRGRSGQGKIQVAEFTFELTSTLLNAKIINLFHQNADTSP